MGYARIYELRPKVVAADPTNYRDTDVADARRLAKEMMEHLTSELTPEGRAAYLLLVRAWTLLIQVYEEVQAVGLHLQRKVPGVIGDGAAGMRLGLTGGVRRVLSVLVGTIGESEPRGSPTMRGFT
jgi:hypothetical protein